MSVFGDCAQHCPTVLITGGTACYASCWNDMLHMFKCCLATRCYIKGLLQPRCACVTDGQGAAIGLAGAWAHVALCCIMGGIWRRQNPTRDLEHVPEAAPHHRVTLEAQQPHPLRGHKGDRPARFAAIAQHGTLQQRSQGAGNQGPKFLQHMYGPACAHGPDLIMWD